MAKPAIPMRSCANHTFQVPEIGVGCWSFGSDEGEYWGKREQDEVNDVCLAALEYGPAFFDTAEGYQSGRSEEALATALEASNTRGCHDTVTSFLSGNAILASKISPNNCSDVRGRLEATLARLGVDSIFLYQVHWPINAQTCGESEVPDVASVFQELMALQEEGKIRHIGVSNFGVQQLQEALATGAKIATNQLLYNVVSRAIEFDVVPLCREHDIGIIAYSPLMQGILTDKSIAKSFDEIDPNRTRTRHFSGDRDKSRHGGAGCETEMRAALDKIAAVAAREGRSVAELCTAWCLANQAVVSIIPGAHNRVQLEQNMSVSSRPLSAELKVELDEATAALKDALGNKIDPYQGDNTQRSF